MAFRSYASRGVPLGLLVWGVLAALPSLAALDPVDDDAQFNAKWALSAARVIYMSTSSYVGVTTKTLKDKISALEFVDDGASSGPTVISLKVVDPKHLRLAAYGKGTCWGVREEGRPGGIATLYAKRAGATNDCKATSFKDTDFHEHDVVWK